MLGDELSADGVLFGLILGIKRLKLAAEVDKQLVFVHPVGEVLELFYYFVLCFVDCHNPKYYASFLSTTFLLSPV